MGTLNKGSMVGDTFMLDETAYSVESVESIESEYEDLLEDPPNTEWRLVAGLGYFNEIGERW